MNPFGSNFRLVGEVLVVLDFIVGLGVASTNYSKTLKTFDCDAPGAPHGVVTHYSRSFSNPDPGRCNRRGKSPKDLISIPLLILFGPILVVGRSL